MSVLAEFSMRPMDKGESVGDAVARLIEIVEESGVEHRVHAMGTLIEGEWDECFALIKECYEALAKETNRVSIDIRVDARKGTSGRIDEKVRRVEEEIGHSVQ